MITDTQRLVKVTNRFGRELPIYDDSWGPLWISRDSGGINGIVRARTWEDAYGICEDEFFDEAYLTLEEIIKEYGFKREHKRVVDEQGKFVKWETIETPDPDAWADNELFQEAYGFRNNSNANDKHKHGIYAKDLNGDYLDLLTPELAAELELTIELAEEEE